MNCSSLRSQLCISSLDDVSHLLGHHDDGNVDVAAWYNRDDRPVHDPKTLDVPDSKFRVDNCFRVPIKRSHLAGSDGVMVGIGQVHDPAVPVFVRFLKI